MTKDYCIRQLRQTMMSTAESTHLTPDQQHAIERMIDELDKFIDQCYADNK